MKPKKAIKLIKSVCDLFKLAIELENKQAERLASPTIPKYSVGHAFDKSKFIVDELKGKDIIERLKYYGDSLEMAMTAKGIITKKPIIKSGFLHSEKEMIESMRKEVGREMLKKRPTTFSQAFEKAKFEDPVLKEAYNEIEKMLTKTKVSIFQQKLNEAMEQAKKAKEQ